MDLLTPSLQSLVITINYNNSTAKIAQFSSSAISLYSDLNYDWFHSGLTYDWTSDLGLNSVVLLCTPPILIPSL
jgi:hypothetical protein